MNLSEAEIQVLASLKEAESQSQPTDRATLEQRGDRYWIFKEEWSGAFASLADKGLLRSDGTNFIVTESGRSLADACYAERPDLYWYYYQRFYSIAQKSEAHSRFCEKVYGKDLSQEGQTDMTCFDDIPDRLHLRPGDKLLDLGCGAGGLSEYVADSTGAIVTGLDYSASAIETATARTEGKRDKLSFVEADLNSLDLPENSFDAAISIDSVYWVADMVDAISSMVRTIKSEGQLCILIEHRIGGNDHTQLDESDRTGVALALSELNLNYETKDYTEAFLKFWPLVKETAEQLREDFAREGASLICDNWVREADEIYLPAVNANKIRRILYHVHV